jgi:hypothetical protein
MSMIVVVCVLAALIALIYAYARYSQARGYERAITDVARYMLS